MCKLAIYISSWYIFVIKCMGGIYEKLVWFGFDDT